MATNMRAHEAGILHADGYGTAPQWLPYPEDVTELMPELWASNVRRSRSGEITVAGLPVTEIAREFGTAAYVMDEGDFRARARAFRDDFTAPFAALDGADVYYAGKAFLCTAVARWIKEEGLFLDTCSGGELAVAQRVDFPPERVALHGNNKSREEIHRALSWGIGRIVVDSFAEIDRVAQIATELGVVAPVMVRVTVGVEAHTHEFIATAHEDQKFGFSLAGGQAREAVDAIVAKGDRLHLLGLHSHIGSQIFDTSGFEIAARRLIALHTEVADEHGIAMPEMDLGGGYGIAYTSENTPLTAEELGSQMAELVERELKEFTDGHPEAPLPRISIEPGRAIAGPSTFTLYEIGTIKDVTIGPEEEIRTYVSVDGGMSDNVRTALYGADYSCALASRDSTADPRLVRIVGRHCESGDIVVMDEYLPEDVTVGDLVAVPATGAYCRSLASQYNHTPRPPVIAVRDGVARPIVRRESIEDILALDVDDPAENQEAR